MNIWGLKADSESELSETSMDSLVIDGLLDFETMVEFRDVGPGAGFQQFRDS